MSRQPTLKQLRYLCAVAEHGHFGQAARACHVSQSTLSAGILELEETLGTPLIERNNRQVLLTTLGEDVVRRAREILDDVEDLVTLCGVACEPFGGKMRLGVIPTVAPFILPRLLNRLREEQPEFQLFIREDLSHHLVSALHHGELDVLLLALPFPADGVETMDLFSDDFLLASPPGHELAGAGKVRIAQLKGEGLLLLEDGHCLREHALEACKLRDSDVSVPYQATSLNTIVQMVANGIGITLLPRMALDAQILSGTNVCAREFTERNVSRMIGLMWRRKNSAAGGVALVGRVYQGVPRRVMAAGGKLDPGTFIDPPGRASSRSKNDQDTVFRHEGVEQFIYLLAGTNVWLYFPIDRFLSAWSIVGLCLE